LQKVVDIADQRHHVEAVTNHFGHTPGDQQQQQSDLAPALNSQHKHGQINTQLGLTLQQWCRVD